MIRSDYTPLALRTASGDYDAIHQRLGFVSSMDTFHAALGMASEAGEVLEVVGFEPMDGWDGSTFADVVAELGDCCWYLNLACCYGWIEFSDLTVRGIEFDLDKTQSCLEDAALKLCLYSSSFCDMVKAHIFYGKDLKSDLVVPVLEGYYSAIFLACASIGVTVEAVLDKNIAKLQARYGDKFSEQRAITRDLELEQKAFSK